MAQAAFAAWEAASAGTVHFVRSTTATEDEIINVGRGDLAAGRSSPMLLALRRALLKTARDHLERATAAARQLPRVQHAGLVDFSFQYHRL